MVSVLVVSTIRSGVDEDEDEDSVEVMSIRGATVVVDVVDGVTSAVEPAKLISFMPEEVSDLALSGVSLDCVAVTGAGGDSVEAA